MMADLCAALPEAEIRVMGLPAMARVTRLPKNGCVR
jgi:malonate decarboxylase gamma subunit